MPSERFILRAALGAAILAPAISQAQSPYSPNYVAAAFAPVSNGTATACGNANIASGAGIANANCTFGGATFVTQGRAVGGMIGAFASVSGLGLLNPQYGGSWSNTALGAWTDRINFIGAVRPATVDLTLSWDGTVSSHVTSSGFSLADANATASWGFQALAATRLALYSNSASAFSRAVVGPASAQQSINDVQSFSLNVGSSLFVDLIFSLQAGTTLSSGGFGNDVPMSGAAVADFNHTGKITSFVLRDANGADVTSQIQYDFENDTQIFPTAVATPEPATLTLLATGLCAVMGVSRRRRRA